MIGADEDIPIGHGTAPAVAGNGQDDSVVAWKDADSRVVVQALRMGVTVGAPIQVSPASAAQRRAAASHLVANEFVVAWEEEGEAGTAIMARRVLVEDDSEEPFDGPVPSMGVTVGAPIQIAAVGNSPAVDADEDGNFAVAWTAPDSQPSTLGQLPNSNRHFVLLVSRMGVTVGAPVQLGASSGATPPDVARRPDGDMLVVWEDAGKDISGALVDASGEVVEDGFRVNHLRLGRQASPAVTVPLDGNFLVVWERNIFGLRFVVGRRIAVDGQGLAGEFLVSPSISLVATEPDVAADAWGRTFVTWTAKGLHHSAHSILGRDYDLSIGVLGDLIVVASPEAVVSAVDQSGNDDDFLVVWESEGNTSSGNVIAGSHIQVP
jgi:hypothetical protein